MMPTSETERQAWRAKWLVVGLLYLTYLCYYLARKADAISKSSLMKDVGFSVDQLAAADTSYLGVYTFALFGAGMVGARVPSNVMLTVGLCGVAACSALKARTRSPVVYAALQGLHAIFQSTGWPTCIKVLATWVTKNRGTVMGFWTTCQSFGGVFGAIAATWFATRYGWESSYDYHVPILLAMAAAVYFFVRDEPPAHLAGYFEPDAVSGGGGGGSGSSSGQAPASAEPAHVSVSDVIALPGVVEVSIAVGVSALVPFRFAFSHD